MFGDEQAVGFLGQQGVQDLGGPLGRESLVEAGPVVDAFVQVSGAASAFPLLSAEIRHLGGELARRAGFNQQLTVERATEILYALLSEETYGLLVAEHGWSVPDWSGWVRRHLRAELFPGT